MALDSMNLAEVTALIVDDDKFVVDITVQMLKGLGVTRHVHVPDAESARDYLARNSADIVFIESVLPDESGAELVKWIRHKLSNKTRYVPVIMLTGYTQMSNILKARDAGAHMVVKKPVSPQVLFDHISWVAESKRPIVEVGTYIGPDRRFKALGPPDGAGQRSTDLQGDLGDATEPNMSQDEIDAMMTPMKVNVT